MTIKTDEDAEKAVIQMRQTASDVWAYFFMAQIDPNKSCDSVPYYTALEKKMTEVRYILDAIDTKIERNKVRYQDFSRWTEEGYQAEGRCLAMGESERD